MMENTHTSRVSSDCHPSLITMFDAEYLYHINHYSLKDHWFQEWILQCWLSHTFIWPIRWYMKVWGSRSRSCISVTLYFIQSLKFVTNDSPGICKIPHQSIQDSNCAIHPVVALAVSIFQKRDTLHVVVVFSSFPLPLKSSTNSTTIHLDLSNGQTLSLQKAEGGSPRYSFWHLSTIPPYSFLSAIISLLPNRWPRHHPPRLISDYLAGRKKCLIIKISTTTQTI